jgi:hypothetical protein
VTEATSNQIITSRCTRFSVARSATHANLEGVDARIEGVIGMRCVVCDEALGAIWVYLSARNHSSCRYFNRSIGGYIMPSNPTITKIAHPKANSVALLRVSWRRASRCALSSIASWGVKQNRSTAASVNIEPKNYDLERQEFSVFG